MAAGDGLISMTPTSIAYSGTSAGINADGGVDFTAVTSLSLNGVFTGDYDNYLIVVNHIGSTNARIDMRLRTSGSDSSGSTYTNQYIEALGSSVAGSRNSSETAARFGYTSDSNASGMQSHMYGPYLAQPTAFRTVDVDGLSNASLIDRCGTHSLSSSYDGLTLIVTTGNFTGTVHVFGYEE